MKQSGWISSGPVELHKTPIVIVPIRVLRIEVDGQIFTYQNDELTHVEDVQLVWWNDQRRWDEISPYSIERITSDDPGLYEGRVDLSTL